ncbi:MAG TPA: hypothetical protein VGL57_02375 [Solirubrobacteraceae bacterium]|jgi:hypothetical protein
MSAIYERSLWPAGFLALVGVLLGMCAIPLPASAGAGQATPLGITKFTIEATERTEEIELGGEAYEFVNVPYTTPFTQAGGHPWALTTSAELTKDSQGPTRDPRDVVVNLPPGLLGDPMATPRCSLTLVTSLGAQSCPADTQVGDYNIHLQGGHELLGAIVNVTPAIGQSAEFALENTTPVETPLLTAHLVRTGQGEYGFTVVSNEIPLLGIESFELTFWGVPADASHNGMRGRFCRRTDAQAMLFCEGGGMASGHELVPFLSLPTDCSAGPETTTLRADSWEEPGGVREGRYTGYTNATATMPGVTGCNLLPFSPSIEVQPDTQMADEPVGLGVNLQVPQTETPQVNATSHLRDAVVTLPEGLSISPGIVDGIQACNESGPEGINFTGPESEEEGPNGELQLAAGHCPNASTVGTAEAVTPLLPEPVKGHIYLARPQCGGAGQSACTDQDALDGNLYQLYLELGGVGPLASTGINIKAHGYVEANPATGQITTKFLENPQAPFSELKIHLNGGPRAPLDSPAVCGPAVTTTDFTPWGAPGITPAGLAVSGAPDVSSSSTFEVTGCASPPGLDPGFSAGMVSPQAGAFSAFTLNLARQDREQYVKGIQVHTPPGLLGMLASVQLCEEPLADSGHCPESSRIGTTRVASGAGSHPFEISGNVYLTTGYDGAPFGLSIVTDAVAGPFNLGLVVVRARIAVDRETSALTITTDETGPYAIPQIIFGVPLRLQRIAVNIDRPGFMFNPTDCAAQKITATISGSQNATASVTSPFAAASCKSLQFKPQFKVATSGRTSRADGADLDVKLSYPAGSQGKEANIALVKVDLPKQLPSQLKTLQKACPAAMFAANPASCPSASVVGIAKASTPLLPVGLEGPVYFVSHGGEAFPSLVVVLQGDGVRVDLTGSTFISEAGITSSTFKTVPDVPVSTFELYLPEGRYSALAANGNLCSVTHVVTVKRKVTRRVHARLVRRTVLIRKHEPTKLSMPTEFVAQNGAVIHQSTPIEVTGCVTAKARSARAHMGNVQGKAGKGR